MQERRRILKVNAAFQNRYILEALLLALVFVNSAVAIAFVAHSYFGGVTNFKLLLALILATTEIAGVTAAYLYLLRTSHRIAGPIFVLKRTLRAIGEGDLSVRMRLRTKDHMKDVAATMNATLERLGERIAALRETAETLADASLDENVRRQASERLRQELNAFRLESTPAAGHETTRDESP